MCGVAFLAWAGDAADARARMARCLEAMYHRGPDAGEIVASGPALLGHRRLSIIDLDASRQPMTDPSGRYVLSYNGEIYNYRDLRGQLAGRWTFRSAGDTEVLLAGLILEGADFLRRCEGMWAFVLWDRIAGRALMGRDRMGKKPLFYQELSSSALACASELPALLALAPGPRDEDPDSVADYLRYGYMLPGTTAWRSVRELLPGHFGTWQAGHPVREEAWWQLTLQAPPAGEDQAAAELAEALTRSVEQRLVADVEVGAFLSGGVDSSLVCGLVTQSLGRPLKSFTIGFADPAFDERGYARLAAQHLGTEHFEEALGDWDEQALERLLLRHVGQPFADASLLPTAWVSRTAARHVKVALSGDGGDELFSGYQRYQARSLMRWYSRVPSGLRHLAERALRALPEPTAHHSHSLLKKAHLFLDLAAREHVGRPYVGPTMFADRDLHLLAPGLHGRGHPPPALPAEAGPDDLRRMMVADALVYLPQDILAKVDRASMAHSLEVRSPFLDSRVVELAFSMPSAWHRRRFRGKRMLSRAFPDLLPEAITRRRKQGFSVPLHRWFRGELGTRLLELAHASPSPLIQASAVKDLLEAHRSGRRDHSLQLWLLFSLLFWQAVRAAPD